MKFRILGGDGGVAVGFQTTSFLINDDILIDAGSAATSLTADEQKKIDYVFISHCHLDHVKDLCFLADNVFGFRKKPIQVISTKENLSTLKKYIFNDKIWPDFSKLSNGKTKIMEWVEIKKQKKIENIVVEACDVDHPVPTLGFFVTDRNSTILVTGDTGPTKKIWTKAHKSKNLKAIFTEIAFPNDQAKVAKASGHFTPNSFLSEYKKIPKNSLIYIYHLKPSYYNEIKAEIDALEIPNMKLVSLGARLEF